MKFSQSLILAALPLLAAAVPARSGAQRGGKGGNAAAKGGNTAAKGATANKGGNNNNAAAAAAAAAAAKAKGNQAGNANKGTAAAASNSTAAANTGAAASNTGNPQTSLTLDPKVLATGFANNGQDQPTAGQVASDTSTNNFINFCLTVPNLPITNGQQIKTGSCNPAPMGVIAANTNIPSAKFVFPANGDTSIKANTAFTVDLALSHLQAGHFTNAQQTFFAAPQTVNAQGDIIGHTHIVIEALSSLAQTTTTNPQVFAFFKGVDDAADAKGEVHVPVAAGLPAGPYRMCTINSSANHQPVLVSVAQHGSVDDCSYFTVGGTAAGNAAANDAGAQAAASKLAAAASTAAPAAAATKAATGAKGGEAAGAAKGTAAKGTAGKGAAAGKAATGAKKAGAGKGFTAKGGKGKRFTREY